MEEEYFLHDGRAKRRAKKITCKTCGCEWLIRKERSHTGYCLKCRYKGEKNPMFGREAHNKGKLKYGISYSAGVRRERKKEIILQMGNKCHRCHRENLPMCCYATHHVNREEKVFSVFSALNHNSYEKMREVMQQEIKKCVLLCLNCHAVEHYGGDTAL